MTTFLLSISAFILMVGILVTFHEFGHFWVARKLGTKVERFSVGFGRTLWSYKAKDGVEYVLGAIPLGGYVKMLDEREGPVAEEDKPYAFNNQNVYKRIAIVVAGPLFNLILAAFFYWLIFVIGFKAAVPIIGAVTPGSAAEKAGMVQGMEIVSVNHNLTPAWQNVVVALLDEVAEDNPIDLILKSENGTETEHVLAISNWPDSLRAPDIMETIGFELARPGVAAQIASVVPGSPADMAGIQAQDTITHLNGAPILWNSLVNYIKEHPDSESDLTVLRGDEAIMLTIRPEDRDNKGDKRGWLGVVLDEEAMSGKWVKNIHTDPISAVGKAVNKTVMLTALTFEMIGKLVTGSVALDSISGPVGMAQGAGQTVQNGFITYLGFLAIVSISLGVMNLLPIPLLDGGHLVYFIIEAITGKPVSDRVQEIGVKIGMMALFGLFSVAMYNDLSRLLL